MWPTASQPPNEVAPWYMQKLCDLHVCLMPGSKGSPWNGDQFHQEPGGRGFHDEVPIDPFPYFLLCPMLTSGDDDSPVLMTL